MPRRHRESRRQRDERVEQATEITETLVGARSAPSGGEGPGSALAFEAQAQGTHGEPNHGRSAAAPNPDLPPHPTEEVPPDLDQMLRPVLDAIPDGAVVVDEAGAMQLVNHQTALLFDYSREELADQPVEMLLPERFRAVHPAHRAHYHAHPHVRPMGIGLQLFGRRRDGGEFPVEISLSPLTVSGAPLVLATIRDVTEQRRRERDAREELEARLTMLRAVLDALPADVYLVRGPDARLVLANQRVAEMWGAEWLADQPMADFLAVCGTRVYDLAGRELALEQLATLQALRTGQSVYQQQEVLHRADGSMLPVQVDAIVLDPWVFPILSESGTRPSDPIPLALVVHQDVSALREAERLKDEFIALAAHELRNPVASLTGYAQMLVPRAAPQEQDVMNSAGGERKKQRKGTQQTLEPWQVEAVEAVAEAARRLTALTDDLLDATRLHANRLALWREPTELGALVRRVVRRLQVTTTTERHPMRVSAPEEPVVVVADAQRVEQVLTNLLANAIKYSPDGGSVEVSVTTQDGDPQDTPIQSRGQGVERRGENPGADAIADAPMDAVARVTVRDHGMGIPVEQQAQIFGRFARAENARQAAIPGTGLGLYLCRELLERQGGHIWFESAEGVGSTFSFELPLLADVPDDEAGEAHEAGEE